MSLAGASEVRLNPRFAKAVLRLRARADRSPNEPDDQISQQKIITSKEGYGLSASRVLVRVDSV